NTATANTANTAPDSDTTQVAATGTNRVAGSDSATSNATTTPCERSLPKTENFADGFERPWGMAFLPDASVLITERPGRLQHVRANGERDKAPIAGLPRVDAREHGGLLDVVLDPHFRFNRILYFSYTEAGRG